MIDVERPSIAFERPAHAPARPVQPFARPPKPLKRPSMALTWPRTSCLRGSCVRTRLAMAIDSLPDSARLVTSACNTLAMSQEELGKVLGVSRRTVSRWSCEGTTFTPSMACTLAKLVHRKNRDLAARFASLGGATLVTLGLEAPAPSPKLLEAVVCAAADALDVSPRSVRPALLAAFRCAREAGLTVEAMEQMLTPKEAETDRAS